ncbi:MAG: Metallophosphoesterase [Acidobacteriota bacterium]|nr:Metallophosphoesterase [Acidobacteriota bacterium]
MPIRILFISDTHLGFDLPFQPRIERRRRGPDFFNNFEIALAPAYNKEIDAIIHGGDLFFRSKVPPHLVKMAFEPLIKAADMGIPVYLVPGNHERSAIPFRLLAAHPNIHIFDRPKTFLLETRGITLALAGFPYVRLNVRILFPKILAETGWQNSLADLCLLCMHHCVEGATLIMGQRLYTFRDSHDTVKLSDIPSSFTAVLSGHIHRFQVLTRDLRGIPIPVPVFYPGSIERTSFTEKDEAKGYLTLEIQPGPGITNWQFHELPARPMTQLELHANGIEANDLKIWLKKALEPLLPDSVVKITIHGRLPNDSLKVLSAESLRSLTPPTMNLTVTLPDYRKGRREPTNVS